MEIHREANATLLGQKILITYDKIKTAPTLYATRGKHNAQYMIVEGEPAYAIIDIKLHYIKER